jgi:hypothetical protein
LTENELILALNQDNGSNNINNVNSNQVQSNNEIVQDYLNAALNVNQRRFFDDGFFESFRWQCLDGGFDFARRRHHRPGTGVKIEPGTSVVVFHGRPKPAEVHDPVIQQLWQ